MLSLSFNITPPHGLDVVIASLAICVVLKKEKAELKAIDVGVSKYMVS